MIGTPTQACIQEAFANRSLMGLGLEGFDSGCGCGSLGATEYGNQGSGEGAAPPAPGSPCDDTSVWALRLGADGKCWNYCTLDISKQYEADASACAIGKNTTGKVQPKTLDMNTMLIIGIGVAAFILVRQ